MPRAKRRRDPEVRIRYGRDEELGKQRVDYAQQYIVFWMDQFGTVNVTMNPEGAWGDWLGEHGHDWIDQLVAFADDA